MYTHMLELGKELQEGHENVGGEGKLTYNIITEFMSNVN